MKPKKTNGGVCKHAIERVRHQYKSSLHEKEIRRILREAKNNSGVREGRLILNDSIMGRLKIKRIGIGRVLVIIILNNDVVTVVDKPEAITLSFYR